MLAARTPQGRDARDLARTLDRAYVGPIRGIVATLAAALAAAVVLAVPASASAARPNLRVAVVSAPASVERGQSIRLADTTFNRGGAAAPASSTAYFLSKDVRKSAFDVRIGGRKVDALKRNRRDAGFNSLAVDTEPGTYRLIACADDGRRIRESSERDNCKTARGRLRVRDAAPPNPPATGTEPAPPADEQPTPAAPPAPATTDPVVPQPDPPAPPAPPPAAPGQPLAIVQSSSRIDLNWPAVAGANSYLVFRDTSSGGPYELAGETSSTTFSATGLTALTQYFFVVVAVGEGGNSAPSPERGARTQAACSDNGFSSPPGTNLGLLAGDAQTLRETEEAVCIGDVDWFRFDVGEISDASKRLEVRLRNISTALGAGGPHSIEMCVWYFDAGGSPDRCLFGSDISLGIVNDDNLGFDDSFSFFVRLRNLSTTSPALSYLRADGAVPCGAVTPCDDIG